MREIEKVASGQSIVPALERVADEAWESHNNEDIPIVEVDEHVLNRPPTFLQQLRECKELIAGVCIVAGAVTEMMLASALLETHYNFVADMIIDTSVSGVAIGAVVYAGSTIAKFLNRG